LKLVVSLDKKFPVSLYDRKFVLEVIALGF
jgi:hypothetical protein